MNGIKWLVPFMLAGVVIAADSRRDAQPCRFVDVNGRAIASPWVNATPQNASFAVSLLSGRRPDFGSCIATQMRYESVLSAVLRGVGSATVHADDCSGHYMELIASTCVEDPCKRYLASGTGIAYYMGFVAQAYVGCNNCLNDRLCAH